MTTADPQNRWRVSQRALVLGLSVGMLASAVAVGGEMLGLFNCISARLIETVVFTLALAIVAGPCRVLAVGSAAFIAYLVIISYVVIHGVHSGRWQADE